MLQRAYFAIPLHLNGLSFYLTLENRKKYYYIDVQFSHGIERHWWTIISVITKRWLLTKLYILHYILILLQLPTTILLLLSIRGTNVCEVEWWCFRIIDIMCISNVCYDFEADEKIAPSSSPRKNPCMTRLRSSTNSHELIQLMLGAIFCKLLCNEGLIQKWQKKIPKKKFRMQKTKTIRLEIAFWKNKIRDPTFFRL